MNVKPGTLPSNIRLVCPRCDTITNVEFLEMESDTVEYAGVCQGRLKGELEKPLLC